MNLLDGLLPGSDPNTPNSFVQTPQQIADQQALANALLQQGSSAAPIQSPWQGAAQLGQALAGAIGSYRAGQAQRLGQANSSAIFGNAIGSDPSEQNIPATPGQTTPALQTSDARNDAVTDAEAGGASPNAALVAALGGAPSGPANPVNPALVSALGGTPTPASSSAPSQAARGMRNNNPGNLESNSWTESLPGYAGTDGRFAIFNSAAAGNAALDQNLQSYGRQGITTPLQIASKWAPGSEAGNNPNSYGGAIASALGVGPNTSVNLADPATRAKIAQAITLVENGPAGGAPPPAVAAINAASPSPAVGAGAPAPGGPQGAGAVSSPAPAPSQGEDPAQLANAVRSQLISSGQASPASGGQVSSPAPPVAAVAPAAQPPIATSATAAPSPGGGAPAPTPQAPPAQGAPNAGMSGFHSNIAGLLQVLSDPWASPAEQQVAQMLLSQQMPTPPTWGEISDDPISGKKFGWISPKTQTVTDANGNRINAGAGSSMVMPPSPSPSPAVGGAPSPLTDKTIPGGPVAGEGKIDAIAAANPQFAALAPIAKAVLRGQQPAPVTGSGQKDPRDMAVMQMVYAANPQFDSGIFAQRQKALEGINDGSNPNSTGGMITNARTSIDHLAKLAQASEALGQYQYGSAAVNGLNDWGARKFNSGGAHAQAAASFDAAKGEFVLEATKFLSGGEGSDSARKSLAEAIDESAPPETRRAAIQTFAGLISDKLGVLGNRYTQGVGSTAAPYETLDPETQQKLKYIQGLGAQQGAAADGAALGASLAKSPQTAAPPRASIPNIGAGDKAVYDALPSGAQYIDPTGTTRTKS